MRDDDDFGSSGPILIPGTSLAVGGGKDGQVFVFDRNNLGQYSPSENNVVQSWQATPGRLFAGHLFYDSKLYLWGRADRLKAFAFNGSTFNTTPVSQGTVTIPHGYSNEPAMSILSKWNSSGNRNPMGCILCRPEQAPATRIREFFGAFDASNLTNELWNSEQNSCRDNSGTCGQVDSSNYRQRESVPGHVWEGNRDDSECRERVRTASISIQRLLVGNWRQLLRL